MRPYRGVVSACLFLLGMAPAARAQEPALVPPPSWALVDLACAPFITKTAPDKAMRVLGTQDTGVKDQMTVGDTLVVSGGSSAGLRPGDRFYVRRLIRAF